MTRYYGKEDASGRTVIPFKQATLSLLMNGMK